jgi:hypothetical protein
MNRSRQEPSRVHRAGGQSGSAAWDPDGSPAKSKPGEAVAMDDDFSDRMTRQQAEHAMRSFAFPGWVCLGIMDMTESEGGWGVMIAPMSESADFSVYVSWRLWIQEWQLECYYRARDRAYRDELAVQPGANPIEFKKPHRSELPYPSRLSPPSPRLSWLARKSRRGRQWTNHACHAGQALSRRHARCAPTRPPHPSV